MAPKLSAGPAAASVLFPRAHPAVLGLPGFLAPARTCRDPRPLQTESVAPPIPHPGHLRDKSKLLPLSQIRTQFSEVENTGFLKEPVATL